MKLYSFGSYGVSPESEQSFWHSCGEETLFSDSEEKLQWVKMAKKALISCWWNMTYHMEAGQKARKFLFFSESEPTNPYWYARNGSIRALNIYWIYSNLDLFFVLFNKTPLKLCWGKNKNIHRPQPCILKGNIGFLM